MTEPTQTSSATQSAPSDPLTQEQASTELEQLRADRFAGKVLADDSFYDRMDYLARRSQGEAADPPRPPPASPEEHFERQYTELMAPPEQLTDYSLGTYAETPEAKVIDLEIRNALVTAGVPVHLGGPIFRAMGETYRRLSSADPGRIETAVQSVTSQLRTTWGNSFDSRIAAIDALGRVRARETSGAGRADRRITLDAGRGPSRDDLARHRRAAPHSKCKVMTHGDVTEPAESFDALAQNPKKVAELLPTKDVTDINNMLDLAFEALEHTLADNPDAESRIVEHRAAARALALSLVLRGSSTKDAAAQAAKAVVNARYSYVATMRIPSEYDSHSVANGARSKLIDASRADLAITPGVHSDSAAAQADIREHVLKEGYWITNEDESGLVLRIPHRRGQGEVYDKRGDRVEFTWAQLIAAAGTHSPGWALWIKPGDPGVASWMNP